MVNVLFLQLKRHKIFLVFFAIAIFFAINDFFFTGIMATVLSWVFPYLLNVEEKSTRSFEFFQSLPISFVEKVILKIVFPFLVVFFLQYINERDNFSYNLVNGNFLSLLVFSSILVFSSLVTSKAIHYIGLSVILAFVSKILSLVDFVPLLFLLVYMNLSILILSNYRLNKTKYISIFGVVSIAILVLVSLSKNLLLNKFMYSSDYRTAVLSSAIQLNRGSQQAQVLLTDNLMNKQDEWTIDTVLESFSDAGKAIPIDQTKWKILLQNNPDKREEILDHLRDNKEKYQWLNHGNLLEVEQMILIGGDNCSDACRSLAKLVVSQDETILWETVREYLNSSLIQKVIYALIIIDLTDNTTFRTRVKELVDHENEVIRELSAEILKK